MKALFFRVFPGQMQAKTKSQGDYTTDKKKQYEMATEQASLSASPKLNITTSHHIFLVSLYLPHLPHMSDNIKSLCSSKVSSIKSTRGSAYKTANVKMAKKKSFFSLNTPLYLLPGEVNQQADGPKASLESA